MPSQNTPNHPALDRIKFTGSPACSCVLLTAVLLAMLSACRTQDEQDEQTARQYCGSCHAFPDASLLPTDIWNNSILPQMAFRMGRDLSQLSTMSQADQREVSTVLPGRAMVTDEQWAAIKRYYQAHSPRRLSMRDSGRVDHPLEGFSAEQFRVGVFPLHTFVSFDSVARSYLLGSRLSKLYQLNAQFIPTDSFALPSPPSMILRNEDKSLSVLLMGIMDPNDQAVGKLVRLNPENGETTTVIDSLKRPVDFSRSDLDADGLDDYIICAFGNYTGNLLAFRNRGNGTFERHNLINLPGARKVMVRDFDNNGLPDILALMSQGDERLILLMNHGKFEFRERILLTFPPVYGSSYFDLADFNGDGKPDILYTNGDNADYSMVLKPYHGVRIFLNNGKNEFKESWFYNMHGASEAVARDFDQDGDVDIAAVSFFPRFEQHAEQGFIYFENKGSHYEPRTTPLASEGRWLRINACDIDADGDQDLLLTALDFNKGIPEDLLASWKSKPVSLMLLRNNHHTR